MADATIEDHKHCHIVHALVTFGDWGYRYQCDDRTAVSVGWVVNKRGTRFLTCLWCVAIGRTGLEARFDPARQGH